MDYSYMELETFIDKNYTQKLKLPHNYTAYISFIHRSRDESRNFLNIFIEASKDIAKYASPEKYPFIFVEYDYTLHVDKIQAPAAYDKCLAANSKGFNCEVNIVKPLEGRVLNFRSLELGDKNWLTAEHSIQLAIPVPFRETYTKREATEIVKLFNKCIIIK